MKYTFRDWNLDKIDDAFGLRQVKKLPALEELTSYVYQPDELENGYIRKLQSVFELGGDDWNEVELENKFISPLIVFSGIDNEEFSYFLERDIQVIIDDKELSGKVDGMIATGFRRPKKPYFCLNEYKKGTDPDGDPKGQALIAMLAAQVLNDENTPIYGCYVIGRHWNFMVLEGKEYAISTDYSCANQQVFDIFRILKSLRVQIEKLINKD
jgi:hypothetical protein